MTGFINRNVKCNRKKHVLQIMKRNIRQIQQSAWNINEQDENFMLKYYFHNVDDSLTNISLII